MEDEALAAPPRKRGRRSMVDRASFAMVDPGLFGLPLFRPLPRRDRDKVRRRGFHLKTEYAGRKWLVFSSFVLGSDDLLILLALLSLAGLLGETVNGSSNEEARQEIIHGLRSSGEPASADHRVVSTSIYAIARVAGLTVCKDTYGRIRNSLVRMATMGYADEGPVGSNARSLSVGHGQNLLSARMDEAAGKVRVILNARFTAALFNGRYVRINLTESRSLSEMARILHVRLAVFTWEGEERTMPLDGIASLIYGDAASSTTQAMDRRKNARRVLKEIADLPGWTITEDADTMRVTVSRAPAPPRQGTRDKGNSPVL